MSEVISLTKAERDKFAAWLEQDAASSEEMAKQMLGHESLRSAAALHHLRAEAGAFLLVAKKLRGMEEMRIG